mgnify:CR=1 FL=1
MKIAILSILAGTFVLRAEIENLVTRFIPQSLEVPLGIGLIIFGLWRIGGVKYFK